jgi:4-hydroxybenzoate polyprenyltransferase
MMEIIKSLRPHQWIKNLFIFAPLIFSENILNLGPLLTAGLAFSSFCLLSGSVYLLNDIKDVEEDRLHPTKCQRPLASGRITPSQAWIGLAATGLAAFLLAAAVNRNFFLVALLYFVLQAAYSLRFKHVVILDVLLIATGFLLRVVAGAVAIRVEISPWLLICTLLLALFLALSKRRHELTLLEDKAGDHRPILIEYSHGLLDQMIAVVTSATVIAYCLYTIAEETVVKFGTRNLIYTVPFVLYGIFRYLYLVHQKAGGGSPETLIIKDRALLADILIWIVTASLIIYLRS